MANKTVFNPFTSELDIVNKDEILDIIDGGEPASTYGHLIEILLSNVIKGGAPGDTYIQSQIVDGGGP